MEVLIKKNFSNRHKQQAPALPKNRINEQIRHAKLRLIAPEGGMIGIVSSEEALKKAEELNLDLVEISPNAKPPVCKIIDYGKFKFELAKKEKENKKKQHVVVLKTIRIMSVTIDSNDLKTKAKKAEQFLNEGNKVKVFLQFRGRQIVHKDQGIELLKEFYSFLEEIAKFDKPIAPEGPRRISMVLAKK